ncbi:unnamed protein product [Arctia plantaginis]|uniref:Uncharacterized protein n=1 Tax=Arctia plantaginis TaxID=874455 RepID=A0A8S0Z7M9_ARCPL|nr:unnamed protein product [Arctia plantaginis]
MDASGDATGRQSNTTVARSAVHMSQRVHTCRGCALPAHAPCLVSEGTPASGGTARAARASYMRTSGFFGAATKTGKIQLRRTTL